MANKAIPFGTLPAPDVMSRHEVPKCRRYELLGGISLCYPRSTLSAGAMALPFVNHRITMTSVPSARAVTLAVKLAYAIALTS